MLESSFVCPALNYSHIIYLLDGTTSVAPQLNYINDIILELKVELVKIKTEVKVIKKQLSVLHLLLLSLSFQMIFQLIFLLLLFEFLYQAKKMDLFFWILERIFMMKRNTNTNS